MTKEDFIAAINEMTVEELKELIDLLEKRLFEKKEEKVEAAD